MEKSDGKRTIDDSIDTSKKRCCASDSTVVLDENSNKAPVHLDSDGDLPDIVQHAKGTVPNEDTTTATVALAESVDSDQFAFPDPDWQAIASHSPAKDDVPLFLDSRQRRHDAEIKFEAALDTAFEALRFCTETLLRVAAEVSNGTLERLNVMEMNIKEILVENDQVRNDMNHKLQQFAVQAQKQFEELMSRLANSKS